MSITREEVLMGRDKDAPLNKEQEQNLEALLKALNKFRAIYGKPMIVSSGYRPAAVNASVGGAKKSSHMSCQACDFKDTDGELDKWCINNVDVLIECGLYLESPAHTPGWAHLQTRQTKNRIFIP